MRLLLALKRELPRVLPLFRDPAVPAWAKLLALVACLFVISPLNVLGDIPLLGIFDDAALLAFVIHQFVRFAETRTQTYAAVPARVERPSRFF